MFARIFLVLVSVMFVVSTASIAKASFDETDKVYGEITVEVNGIAYRCDKLIELSKKGPIHRDTWRAVERCEKIARDWHKEIRQHEREDHQRELAMRRQDEREQDGLVNRARRVIDIGLRVERQLRRR